MTHSLLLPRFLASLAFSLVVLAGMTSTSWSQDPFGDEPAIEAEVEEVEVEEEVVEEPSYETEQVALTPRADWMLDFPHTRTDLLRNRINLYGFVDNRHEWASLWVLCNGRQPLPKVDFTSELVVYFLNGKTDDRLPAVAFVTDGNLSLQESYFRGQGSPRKFLAPMHVQVVPREGLVRLAQDNQTLLIPGGFLAEPANPTE